MNKTKIYKTKNFGNPTSWVKRTFFVGLFGLLIYIRLIRYFELSLIQTILFVLILIILIAAGQIDELEINHSEIIVEQKSFIPFLKSKRKYKISDIKNIRKNSNYVEGDGSWLVLLFRSKKAVEIIFNNGDSEIINSKLHPKGFKGLKDEIINKTAANTS